METTERIVIDPRIQHGKPVVRGTRVPVARVIAELAGGMTDEEVMREYGITREDVAAALAYAADLVEDDLPLSVVARVAEEGGAYGFLHRSGEDIYAIDDGEAV
jgi:uncharacterized protein (DUF433 family)